MKTLREIVAEHKSLDQVMIENGGELTDSQQEEIILSWMNDIKSDLANKIDNYKYKQDSLESAAELLRSRAKLMSKAAKSLENMSEILKQRLKEAMHELSTTEITGNDFKFKIYEITPELIVDEQALPSEYFKTKTEIVVNKDKIREDLYSGKEVVGARLSSSYALKVVTNKKIKEIK